MGSPAVPRPDIPVRPECILPAELDRDPLRPPQLARKVMPEPEALGHWSDAVAGQVTNAIQVDALREFVKRACQDAKATPSP